ncbi:MAG: hypothetical protein J5829_07755 [Lachnospiraceae bacterium]|nr:hypothetical protein [Lachnospiraceae bacterium]
MRIGAGVPSFYNASSKINDIGNIDEINSISPNSAASSREQDRNEASQYIAEHGGVVQTKVSPENAYQKAMLDSPRARVEDMAEKLVSKMPRILEDMKRLVPDETEAAASNEKVVINENNAAAVADKAKQNNELMNFSIL